ncbi:hypothetical protein DYH09_31660 [bacterium CPR1]|nr:hypothetical protein [bacterium CPR1]
MTGPLPPELLRCPKCSAAAHRLELMGATHVRCLECRAEWPRASRARTETRYKVDYAALHPSIHWQSIYGPAHGEMPPNPLLAIEALVDWQARGRTRRRDCGACLGWLPGHGETRRPGGDHRPDPGPGGSCAGCALSYLDAVDPMGREVQEIPATYLASGTRAAYVELQDYPHPPDPCVVVDLGRGPITVYTRLAYFEPVEPRRRQILGMVTAELMAANRQSDRPKLPSPGPTRTAVFDGRAYTSDHGGRRYAREWNAGGWLESPGRKPYVIRNGPGGGIFI